MTRRFYLTAFMLLFAATAFAEVKCNSRVGFFDKNYAGIEAAKSPTNKGLTGFAKKVVERINEPCGQPSDAYFLASGTGTYQKGGGAAVPFNWVSFTNSDGLYTMATSIRLDAKDLTNIAALSDMLRRPYEARFSPEHGVTYIFFSNDWSFTKEEGYENSHNLCSGIGSKQKCNMPDVVNFYHRRLQTRVANIQARVGRISPKW